VQVGEGRVAFVPDPLPTALSLDAAATDALVNAEYALGRLAGVTATVDSHVPVLAPLQSREALLSSRIDRIISTPERLVLMAAGAADGTAEERAQTRSVLSCVRTIERGLGSALPPSVRLLSELHAVLVAGESRGIESHNNPPEEAEASASTDDRSRVVRLPVRDMQSCLDAFESRLQTRPTSIPVLVELALLHYQFEAIHPFRQGNGRLGRLLLTLVLARQKRVSHPFLYFSAYFESHRDEYFESLRAVSERGAWLPWVTLLLRAVEDSATECLEHVEGLVELHEHYHALFRETDSYDLLHPLIDSLFELPCISVPRAASSLDVTELVASHMISALVSKGILFGVSGLEQDRMFFAPAILGFMRSGPEIASPLASDE
jgi:Fic family protein